MKFDYQSPAVFDRDMNSVAELCAARRAVMRHSLNGFMSGSRDALRWLDSQIAHFERRINDGVIWC